MALPKQITINLPGGVPMEFRLMVDDGEIAEFRMGSRGNDPEEEPIHEVIINLPYYLGVTPVTQAQYRAMAGKCLPELEELTDNQGTEPSHFEGEDRPVEQVDWRDAETVCEWLKSFEEFQNKLPADWQAGLPTEAQWEYACRAGTKTEFYTGDGAAALEEAGWFGENSGRETHAVGEKCANGWGLYDLHGNVWEWCRDVFDPRAYAKRRDGWKAQAWSDGDAGKDAENQFSDDNSSCRVLRGGSWVDSAAYCRSAFRYWHRAASRHWVLGFRVCLFPGPVTSSSQPDK